MPNPLLATPFIMGSPVNINLFKYKLQNLATRIVPFYRISDGLPHPYFPRIVLHFWLLNEEQLDEIAIYYSQAVPDELPHMYPTIMNWDQVAFARMGEYERLLIKRQELGRFIRFSNC